MAGKTYLSWFLFIIFEKVGFGGQRYSLVRGFGFRFLGFCICSTSPKICTGPRAEEGAVMSLAGNLLREEGGRLDPKIP